MCIRDRISRKRIKRERSTPNSIISRLYTSNLIQLVTVLINSTDRLQKPYVRTQLAIATAKNNELMCSNSAIKVEINIIQLVTELINERWRKQPYVRTQLAIAALTRLDSKERKKSRNKNAFSSELTKKNDSSKVMNDHYYTVYIKSTEGR